MQDEEALVQKAKQRDQKAFAQLYEGYFDKIYRYIVIKIGNQAEAEDMTQQVFLNALQSISSYKWQGVPFSAWLYRIAHNQVVDYLRKKSKRPAAIEDDTANIRDSKRHSDPQEMTELNLDIEQLAAATQKLTEAQREVISLRFSSDLSTAEVAKIMGRSQGAIKALQHSAILALRKALVVEINE
ncbi:MAG: sigma-70 family RNA polymerase sigma factor [Chloroflexi bacterium]|nr:sigma-70 family RNA polymerase sigma factor [Chloroflexota bacterium]